MLGNYLEGRKCHSQGDADVTIVQKAVQSATVTDTVVMTQIFWYCYAIMPAWILVPYFLNLSQRTRKKPRVWNISAVKQELGSEICSNLLFLHDILGCDTTSQLYGIGKGASFKKFRSTKHFQEQAKMFCTTSATPKDIIAAGEQALVMLYNGKPGETLDCLCYKYFCEKVCYKYLCEKVALNITFVHPQTLPPTSVAAKCKLTNTGMERLWR